MKTKEKILDYLAKKPMATVEDITGELGMSHQTVATSLSTLRKRGKVKATDSRPAKYVVPLEKPVKGNDGQQNFGGRIDGLDRENQELRGEVNRLHGELNECRRKLSKLAQRIVRETLYGKD
jgi:DNA-binding transcriptional ArsR family regulator